MNPQTEVLTPSGDKTGKTDSANIQQMLDAAGCAMLGAGWFFVDSPPTLKSYNAIVGRGPCTRLRQVNSGQPVVLIKSAAYTLLRDLWLEGGLYGVEIVGSRRVELHNLCVYNSVSHGVYAHGSCWIIKMLGGYSVCNKGDGLHMVSAGAGECNGNALALHGVDFSANKGYGVIWAANGLDVSGCCVQNNELGGLCLSALTASAVAVSVTGSYFETPFVANIICEAAENRAVAGVSVCGNTFGGEDKAMPHILIRKTDNGVIKQLLVDRSNWLIDPDRSFSGNASALLL